MKSDIDIKDDIYRHIMGSSLEQAVTGKVCKRGVRPKGSTDEDIVLSVSSNENGQIQEAKVNVNVYVKDDVMRDGQHEEASIRLKELCVASAQVLERGIGDDYLFTLDSQVIIPSESTNEHVISNRLTYKQNNE